MTQFEKNQIRSKLCRLNLNDDFIDQFISKSERNFQSYASVCAVVDRWEKQDSGQLILQALVCGLIAAIAGAWLAVVR